MFCINYDRLEQINNYILYLMPSGSDHAPSIEGEEFLREAVTHVNKFPCYYAETTYVKLTKNSLEMWTKLYNERVFPFWDPEGGPYKLNNNNKGIPKPTYIAICKVYGLNTPFVDKDDINKQIRLNTPFIGKDDISKKRKRDAIRQITNAHKVDLILNALNNKVQIAETLYQDHSKRILEIVNEYDAGSIRK